MTICAGKQISLPFYILLSILPIFLKHYLLCKAELGFNEPPLLKLHIFLKMKNAMYNVFSCM